MPFWKTQEEKEEKWEESIGRGEEPGKFFRNWFKLGLLGVMLSLFIIFFWVYISYPDAAVPIFISGVISLSICGSLTGLLEYWLVEKEGTYIKLGLLSAMPFLYGEYPMSTTVTFKTADGEEHEETWVGGRLGKRTGWWGSWGGGKKGYYVCKLLKKARLVEVNIDPDKTITKVIWEDVEEPGSWKGNLYDIPMDFTRTSINNLYDEVATMIKNDTARYRWNSRIYAAERPLPEKFRKARSPTNTETIIHALNEEKNELRAEVRRLYKDRARDKSTQPDTKKEVHHYHSGPGAK